jgi:glutamate--cysteine ligase
VIRNTLHQNFCDKHTKLSDWFCQKTKNLSYPIYSSYDIRDAGFKISNVDANIYPAGFNNICPADRENSISLMGNYIDKHYGSSVSNIMLVTEEHTGNPFYWENVLTIEQLLKSAGKKVLLAIPRVMDGPLTVQSATGKSIEVHSAFADSAAVKEFGPQLIISNNDFSQAYEEWAQGQAVPINPPRELGWYQRKKSNYFQHFNRLADEFAGLVGIDPFILNVQTEVFEQFDITDDQSRQKLADRVDAMIENLRAQYRQRHIDQEPFVFVKNNAGTYGLAVIRVSSGAEVKEWNYKSRKKMKAAKGGRDVEEVIIQEGIPTRVQAEGATAEPVIYMIGSELAGGFLRTHLEKDSTDSLNSPGAVYKRLCVSDLNVDWQGSPLENVYGWSARLGLLAIADEAKQMKVEFKNYK